MKTYPECFPCFIRQTIIALSQVSASDEMMESTIKDVMQIACHADTSMPPAYATTLIHRHIRRKLGCDPFERVKSEYNDIALGLYPQLKEKVKKSADPLWTAARLAIAGNCIDFGIFTSIDIGHSLGKALEPEIAVDDYESFREAVAASDDILCLLDNAGEAVFDRLLVEELIDAGKKVRVAVKGSAVLNDVTMKDAVQTGLSDICEVVSNGSDGIGTILKWTSPSFQDEFEKAGLIISKGQGNFETLAGEVGNAFFLFQSKCEVVSRELGLEPNSMLLKKS